MVMEEVEPSSVSIINGLLCGITFCASTTKNYLAGFNFPASEAAFTNGGNKGDTSAANNNTTLDFSFAHHKF